MHDFLTQTGIQDMPTPEKPALEPKRAALGMALSLGTQLAVGMVVFTLLGSYIDRKRGGGYAFTLSGIFVGLFYCGYEVWKLVHQLKEDEETK
jgi:hypothetical protein